MSHLLHGVSLVFWTQVRYTNSSHILLAFPVHILIMITLWIHFLFVNTFSKYLDCPVIWNDEIVFHKHKLVLLVLLIKCYMESGKEEYIFSNFFSNYFDSCRDGNLYKTVMHSMQSKTVVMKEHPVILWDSTHDYYDFTELYYWKLCLVYIVRHVMVLCRLWVWKLKSSQM
jgi:hypothetical protein